MVRKSRSSSLLLSVLVLGLFACAEEEPGISPPHDRLHFPTGSVLTPESAEGGRLLLVHSSNFDLRYRSGVLHAFDLERLDRLADEAPPAPNCPPDAPLCSPPVAENLADALVGSLEVGSFGGRLGVARLPDGRLRAFLPMRGVDEVVAVEIEETGSLRCALPGDERCSGPRFPRPDPYELVVEQGNVYVANIGRERDVSVRGIVGAAPADSAVWTDGGRLTEIRLGGEAIGGIAAGACRATDSGTTCSLVGSSRSLTEGTNRIFLFDFQEGALRTGPVFEWNLYPQQRGLDSRGVAFSSDGGRVYQASRFPAALVTVDVSRVDPAPVDGCVVDPGELLPDPIVCPPGPVPPDGEATPRFATADLAALPPGPNVVVTIPRQLPDGTGSDLVVVTVERGIRFVDTRTGTVAGAIEEGGSAPSSIAWRPHGTGVRLYVPSFGRGTIAVIDVPDLFRPASARVVANLGRVQEGGF